MMTGFEILLPFFVVRVQGDERLRDRVNEELIKDTRRVGFQNKTKITPFTTSLNIIVPATMALETERRE